MMALRAWARALLARATQALVVDESDGAEAPFRPFRARLRQARQIACLILQDRVREEKLVGWAKSLGALAPGGVPTIPIREI
jgi:hypothetical protein